MRRYAEWIVAAVVAVCAGAVYAQGRELGELRTEQAQLAETVREYVDESRQWQRLLMATIAGRPMPTPASEGE